MPYVRRVFEMVSAQGWSLTRVKNTFEREGIRTPGGSLRWETSIVRRIIQNDAYLSRTKEEVASLVDPAVAEKLDGERFGIYWYGQFQASRNYTGRKAFDVRPQDRNDWIAVPIPDAGIPPEWVHAARERIRANTRYQASTDPRLKLRGFIRCACGRSMTTLPEPGKPLLRVRRPPGTQHPNLPRPPDRRRAGLRGQTPHPKRGGQAPLGAGNDPSWREASLQLTGDAGLHL